MSSSSYNRPKPGQVINRSIKRPINRPARHRFNRAGDIADDIAGALFSRDPAHRENPEIKRRLSRMPSRIKQRFEPNPESVLKPDLDAVTRIWDTCCQRCLNASDAENPNSNPNSNSNPPDPNASGPNANNQLDNPQRDERFEATGARLVWIDADEAVVYAQSPIWATRVRMLAPSLVACMRQSGLTEISRLRVRVQPTETVPVPRSRPVAPMSPESAEILNAAADRSPDEDLAQRLKRLARHVGKPD